jgi:hypothetical protein
MDSLLLSVYLVLALVNWQLGYGITAGLWLVAATAQALQLLLPR